MRRAPRVTVAVDHRRRPTPNELSLVEWLVSRAKRAHLEPGWDSALVVQAMSDGGMGSLRLLWRSDGPIAPAPKPFAAAAEGSFHDADGQLVIVTLYVDGEGCPTELDIWKADFSPVQELPSSLDDVTTSRRVP